jgi:hypothetical protein
MIFSATELELFLRVLILRLGGEAVLSTDDRDIAAIDHYLLFAEAVQGRDNAIKFSVARVDEEQAGHA